MAGELPPLVVEILLKTEELQKQMTAVQTQMDNVGKAAERQHGPINSLKEGFKELGATMAKSFAVLEIVKFLKESATAAIDNQQSFALMERQLHATTGATHVQTEAIDKQLEALSENAGVLVTKIRPAYDVLVRATGDSTKAMQLQKLAMDVSAGTGKDLEVVTKAMARAYAGNSASLNKLVPGIKNSKDQMGYLEKQFSGAAKIAGDTNPYARMAVIMEKIKVTLGKALLPLFTSFNTILIALTPLIELVADFIGKVVKAVAPLIKHLATALMPALTAVAGVFTKLPSAILPPLVKLIDILLVPVISFLAQVVERLVHWWNVLLAALKPVYDWIAKHLVAAFKTLSGVLKPFFETVLKPILDTLMHILGIKEVKTKVSVTADKSSADLLGGIGSAAGLQGPAAPQKAKGKTVQQQQDAVYKAIRTSHDAIDKANKTYNASVIKAQNAYTDAIGKANDKFAAKSAELTAKRDEDIAALNESHANNVANIQKDFAARLQDIVQQSMNRLRDVFSNATKIDVGSIFHDTGSSVDNLLIVMRNKLAGAKDLIANSAKLSGLGFSQTFIEQIVAQGPDAGNLMAKNLLAATPETQKQLQQLFVESETTSAHGMDALAQTMYDKAGLATEELRNLYTKTQADLAQALADEQTAYQKAMVDIQKEFDKGMAEAQKTRDTEIKTAQDDLNAALVAAAKKLEESLASIEKSFMAKIAAMKGALGGLNSEIAATNAAIAASAAAAAKAAASATVVAPKATTTAPKTGVTLTSNVYASTNATPSSIATAAAAALKYNIPLSLLGV